MKKLSILLIVFSFFIASAGAAEGPSAPDGAPKKTLSELNEAKIASREAKENAEVAISDLTKAIENLETGLRKIEDESVRAMAEMEKRADKMVTAAEAAVASELEQATKHNMRILNKRLQILKARVRTEEELLQAREEVVALVERELRLELEVQTLSIDDAASAKSDVVVAGSQLQEMQSTRREKKAVLGSRKGKLRSEKHKAVDDREFADKELKRHEKLSPKGGEAEKDFLSDIASLQQMRLANVEEEIETAKHNIKLAEKELERAELEESNAERKLTLLKKRSSLLEKRLSDVEMIYLRKEEALKKVGELEQQKLAAVVQEQVPPSQHLLQAEAEMAELRSTIATLEARRKETEEEAVGEGKIMGDRWERVLETVQASQLEEAAEEGVVILNEEIAVLRMRLHNEEELLIEQGEGVGLSQRMAGLRKEVRFVSALEATTAQEEVGVAKAYLHEAEDRQKSRMASLEEAKERLRVVREETKSEVKRIKEASELLERLPFQKDETPQRFKRNIKRLHQRQLANLKDRLAMAEHKIKLHKIGVKKAETETSNARTKVELLEKRAALLKERLKAETQSRMEEEIDRAQRKEEEEKKKATLAKKAAHTERAEALKKVEEIARKRVASESPEERRLLALEAILYELRADIAEKKEHHIVETLRHYEIKTASMRLNRDVVHIMGGENISSEVTRELLELDYKTEIWAKKLAVVESLAEAIQKEKALLTERLKRAQEELVAPPGGVSEVAEDAEAFKDKTLAEKYVPYANERVKLLEEDLRIVNALGEKIQKGRRALVLEGLQLLSTSQNKLIKIRESNVWVRRKWTSSWSAMKADLRRLFAHRKLSWLIRMPGGPSERKVPILPAVGGVLALIAGVVFGSYYCRKWCQINLNRNKEAGH